ncbi:type II secretion system protein GspD [Pseudoleptotrichia goodfellowii]|uniref:Bacterial type II/III secretion system short domain protein n=1 Tax=Pseudoleptotrichia goodfellowii F0264 TaxID=596323 RepID=D0GP57_9FUSO|nr:general secretion pathway protein GspD [Pseudoleptotrichia goodfellowii]EEY34130.1 bacterial type II/III secretion system short domain protein [Pseudoleptotrichia goodfellowii F0264]
MTKIIKNRFINILFTVFYFVTGIYIFPAKITDYVNKEDAKKANKIFIYKDNRENINPNQEINKTTNQKENNGVNSGTTGVNGNNQNVQNQKKDEKIEEINLEYRDVKEVSEKLNGFNNLKLVGIDNKIIISGEMKEIEQIRKIIKSLDRPKDQIIIKGTIIDTSSNLFEKLGVDWNINSNNPEPAKSNLVAKFLNGEITIGSIFASGGKFLGIDFNLLRENGDIKIEAMPTLLIMEDEEGELKVTEEVLVGEKKTTKNNTDYTEPIFSEAGIVFKILPEIRKINGEKKILLKIDTEISNFKLTSNYSSGSGAKQKNQTKTIITLNNGGSTFIGGLKQNVTKETIKKVPFFSSIPIIGPLFKYKRNNKEVRDIYIEIEAVIQEMGN